MPATNSVQNPDSASSAINQGLPTGPKSKSTAKGEGARIVANRRKAAHQPEPLPPSHLVALDRAGFTVIRYLNKAERVATIAGDRSEWLPSLCVAPGERPNSYRVIEWLPKGHPANAYGFDGWQASDGHAFGGMYETVHGALGWFDWSAANR